MFWPSNLYQRVAILTCTRDWTVTHLIERMFGKDARFELRDAHERFVGFAVAENKDERPNDCELKALLRSLPTGTWHGVTTVKPMLGRTIFSPRALLPFYKLPSHPTKLLSTAMVAGQFRSLTLT